MTEKVKHKEWISWRPPYEDDHEKIVALKARVKELENVLRKIQTTFKNAEERDKKRQIGTEDVSPGGYR